MGGNTAQQIDKLLAEKLTEVSENNLETDEEGYLNNIADWKIELAEAMARVDGLELGADHWEIINFLRDYYDRYQVAPPIRILTREVGKKLGEEKGNSAYLFKLFPMGPAKQACRYGGLPKPTGCV